MTERIDSRCFLARGVPRATGIGAAHSGIVLLIVFIVLPHLATASVYYVDATNGNDSNGGLSEGTAWQTISKVNSVALSPGDSVLFKRGEIWREQLLMQSGSGPAAHITYSTYGTGAKPQIRRSIAADDAAKWVCQRGNIWELDEEFPHGSDVAFISANNDEIIGRKMWSEAALGEQNDFWTDESNNNRTRVYSAANPASIYNDIEVAIHEIGIHGPTDLSWVILDNLHPCYCGWSGIELPPGSHDIVIRNCDISYCGGGHQGTSGSARNGQGINTRNSLANAEIHNCRIWQCWDGGIALQGYWKGGLTIHNINVHHNIISHCHYGFEFWGKESNSDLQHIHFENNTCLYSGYGWSYEQRPHHKSGSGAHIQIWRLGGVASDLCVRNNIFFKGKGALLHLGGKLTALDFNCYYRADASTAAWKVGSTQYTLGQFADWQNDSGFDTHSIVAEPVFSNRANGDVHLGSASPCIDKGMDLGFHADFDGNSIPQGTSPDIGAYESQEMPK